ncbi:hypothetical protein ANO11243_072910 [Dothideomycetidae sp. 11243]|nr:hypothetical protein ANO11243_072910 [fungal sp. No.11243]
MASATGQTGPDSLPEITFVSLPHKPTARLAVRYLAAQTASEDAPPTLVVFLNGMMTTAASWTTTIAQLLPSLPSKHNISLLTYDRYGQGESDRDPSDATSPDPSHGHNLLSSAEDLSHLVQHFSTPHQPRLILVGNSIGCALARVYAERFPARAPHALLLLDSILAHVNMLSLFPDPDASGFEPGSLPEGVTESGLRATRMFMAKVFDPANGSAEGLSRRDLASLLPRAGGPRLLLPGGKHGPLVTVVGHGSERFAAESAASGMDAASVLAYLQPCWERYNEELLLITSDQQGRRGIQAVGAGHFVQRDRPDIVTAELLTLLEKIGAV